MVAAVAVVVVLGASVRLASGWFGRCVKAIASGLPNKPFLCTRPRFSGLHHRNAVMRG